MVKISVVIPIYNMEQYIDNGIKQILKEDLTDVEIILVNDGSSDRSGEICDSYLKKSNKIRVIHKKNGGAGSARNSGIDNANGKYIMFLDIDDIVEKDIFKKMYEEIESSKVDLVICNHNIIKENEIVKNAKNIESTYIVEGVESCRKSYVNLLQKSLIQTPWDKIYKLDLIRKNNIRFTDLRRCQDAVFNCNYFNYVKSYKVLNESLYNYKENNLRDEWLKFPKNYFDICVSLDNSYMSSIKKWDVMDEDKNKYLCGYFIDQVTQCFKYSFSPKWGIDSRERKKYIKEIVSHERVQEAINIYEPYSLYKRIIAFFIKTKSVTAIDFIVKVNLFFKLKLIKK